MTELQLRSQNSSSSRLVSQQLESRQASLESPLFGRVVDKEIESQSTETIGFVDSTEFGDLGVVGEWETDHA